MKSFQELDNLLHTAYDNLNKQEEDYAYLSSKNILKDITNNNKNLVDLENLRRLKEKLQLTSLETNTILILFALEVDPKYERIFAYIQDNMNMTYVTVELLNVLLCTSKKETEALYGYFIAPFKLSILNIISFSTNATSDIIFKKPILLAPSVRNYLLGDIHLQGTLAEYCSIIEPLKESDTPSSSSVEKHIEANMDKATDEPEHYLINIYGDSLKKKKEEIRKIASYFNAGLLYVDTKVAMQTEESFEKKIASLLRDALLTGTLLYFESFEHYLKVETKNEVEVLRIFKQLSWITFLSTKNIWNPRKIPNALNFYSFENKRDDHIYIEKYWQNAIQKFDKKIAKNIAPMLANTFNFIVDEIDNIIQLLQIQNKLGQSIDKKMILDLCRSKVSSNIDKYAQHITSSNNIDDIVIPQKQKTQLQEIQVHYNHQIKVFEEWGYDKFFQSKGLSMLFSGSSGTGKTMAASILANALGLELYKIDLSQMMSKYIGDTEKQLASLFNAAEALGIVLFFDEADSVFRKRTTISSSHDSYANTSVSYLLQKIEEYEGIVILASNFKENIDSAFLRRLRFVVDFPSPDAKQRELLWGKLLPLSLLKEPIDLRTLSKNFKFSGANIRNVSLYAAFHAAGDEGKITVDHIVKALKSELEKVGLPYGESDLKI